MRRLSTRKGGDQKEMVVGRDTGNFVRIVAHIDDKNPLAWIGPLVRVRDIRKKAPRFERRHQLFKASAVYTVM